VLLGPTSVRSASPTHPPTIRGRDAVRFKGALFSCAYALAVSRTSRVDVIATTGTDTALACRSAEEVALLIEPNLP